MLQQQVYGDIIKGDITVDIYMLRANGLFFIFILMRDEFLSISV